MSQGIYTVCYYLFSVKDNFSNARIAQPLLPDTPAPCPSLQLHKNVKCYSGTATYRLSTCLFLCTESSLVEFLQYSAPSSTAILFTYSSSHAPYSHQILGVFTCTFTLKERVSFIMCILILPSHPRLTIKTI